MGCLAGVAGRFDTDKAAMEHVRSSADRRVKRPKERDEEDCADAFEDLDDKTPELSGDAATDAVKVDQALTWYYNYMVRERCVTSW